MQPLFIVGDSHFGSGQGNLPQEEKLAQFLSFIDFVDKEGGNLVLLGDIFDFWFEYPKTIPKDYFPVLRKLGNFAERHEAHFVVGNHDLWAGRFFEDMNIKVHRSSLRMKLGSFNAYLTHGDVLRKRDLGGRTIRTVMGNSVSVFLFKLIHPTIGISIAKLVSFLSRENSIKKSIKEPIPRGIDDIIREGFDIIVVGHIHYPILKRYKEIVFLSIGDWMWHFTYGLIEKDSIKLVNFLSKIETKVNLD